MSARPSILALIRLLGLTEKPNRFGQRQLAMVEFASWRGVLKEKSGEIRSSRRVDRFFPPLEYLPRPNENGRTDHRPQNHISLTRPTFPTFSSTLSLSSVDNPPQPLHLPPRRFTLRAIPSYRIAQPLFDSPLPRSFLLIDSRPDISLISSLIAEGDVWWSRRSKKVLLRRATESERVWSFPASSLVSI